MKVSLTSKSPLKIASDLLIFFVTQNFKEELLVFLDKEFLAQISDSALIESFTGKDNQYLFVDTHKETLKKILLYGVAEKKTVSIYELQKTLNSALILAGKSRRKKVILMINPDWLKQYPAEILGKTITEAAILSMYTFDKYKGEKHHKEKIVIEELFIHSTLLRLTAFEKGINLGKLFAKATIFARDLVNEPAQTTTPSYLGEVALNFAKEKQIKARIYEKEEIKKMGMNAFLAVAQGSDTLPKLIKLSYKPSRETKRKIVLIGKGITFDSGGLSLKSSNSMETMKIDMAGAASVLGIFSILSELKLNIEIVGLIAACENMPSGKALKPGDIVTAYNGKSIEILNTDAEGRVTLADVLSFAETSEKPEVIIDLATLTGAIMVALGQNISGLFYNNQKLGERIKKASLESGELVWEMPLYKDYEEQIKSSVADLKNSTKGREAGAITAALFLQEFIKDTPWAHLDIAGPVFAEKPLPLCQYGATGFGVRLILHLLTTY